MTNSNLIYRRVPIVHEALADLDTPLSVYLKLARGPYSYLLESAQGGEKWGRYSIIGLPARTVLKVNDRRVQVLTDNEIVEEVETDDRCPLLKPFRRVSTLPTLTSYHASLVAWWVTLATTPSAMLKNDCSPVLLATA